MRKSLTGIESSNKIFKIGFGGNYLIQGKCQ